ncbi:hypothetical protein [Anaeromicrobium sediminis]|uniref:Uncharacterized protein n=1 Tax=Anaeromicrobium sediminis TaxID=1478221 RepID=A0A267MGL4_9FIRM|nr:hypothetical protein [Anaeromicrobium sediminis]PAB58607.1 hypothetical protein CCE28_14075 [Anaeromicrobium sediminis]
MKRKSVILLMSGILIIGGATGFGYAATKDNKGEEMSKFNMERKLWKNEEKLESNKNDKYYEGMIEIMSENGYGNMADYMSDNDYKSMDEFMNNMTDKDYDNMINIMRSGGYEDMARMMESIDKDTMIQMHNSMGGAEGCHSDSSNRNSMYRFK